MTHTEAQTEHHIFIEGIAESVIVNYFATINREEFAATAALFEPAGEMLAPFEKPIVGREAIATYLDQEARGMKLLPSQGICETTEDGIARIRVSGKVKTSLFSVNVAWFFHLNADRQLTKARIKLLASPQELLGLQSKTEKQQAKDT
ncbi:nuclear transport factor 2 family protein [Pleurocapsales cyanobacterium LEGE 10410]|nr:nuclear transport factor 2 family protein [Pleurocapsales cyanobacterium LEGE 10410]